MDLPPPPISQPEAQVQIALDVTATYLARRDLAPGVRATPGRVSAHPHGHRNAAAAVSLETGNVELSPRAFESAAAFYRARWTREPLTTNSVATLLHEQLHLVSSRASEGLVEAVAQDHARGLLRRWTGTTYNLGVIPAYPRATRQIWHESALACASDWDSPCARAYRRHLLRNA